MLAYFDCENQTLIQVISVMLGSQDEDTNIN